MGSPDAGLYSDDTGHGPANTGFPVTFAITAVVFLFARPVYVRRNSVCSKSVNILTSCLPMVLLRVRAYCNLQIPFRNHYTRIFNGPIAIPRIDHFEIAFENAKTL